MSTHATTIDVRGYTDRTALGLAVIVVGTLALLLVAISVGSGPAAARFPIDNITLTDETAELNPSGHNVVVTGTTQCTAGEIVEIEVTVRQDGVAATGQTRERCLGEDTILDWSIHAATRGPASLMDGDAHVWAEARTYARGAQTDDHDWDSDIELVPR